MKKTLPPLLCMLAVLGLGYLLKLAFSLPTTELATALPRDAGPGTRFALKDGSSFPGRGKIRIGDEVVSVERVNEQGVRVKSGVDTLKHPGSFQVIARGADGTAVAEHTVGTRVSQLGTLFFPENNATYGKAVDDLFYLILWITGIAFVLTEGFLLYIILSFWAKPGQKALYTHGNHKLELVWTVIPAVILVTLAILQSGMWREMKVDQPRPGEPNVVPVQVAAQTYNWFFRYPGKDGQFGTVDDVTSAVLKVPVGRKVALTIRSRDTIHSFFLPNFRLKQDAVPGLAVPAWFEAMRTGVYTVMCAELCGAQHFTMAADMEVLEADAFDAWVQERSEAGKEERDGMDRPDWMGDMWWWWDSVPTATGFVGDRPSR